MIYFENELLDNGDQKRIFDLEIQMAASISILEGKDLILVQTLFRVFTLIQLGVQLLNRIIELH